MPLVIEELDVAAQGQQEQEFTFHYLPVVKFASVGSDGVQPLLDKWGFAQDMTMCTFRVEQQVTESSMQAMLESFFRSQEVIGALRSLTQIAITSPDKVR